ncbi:MAG: hypothetical protein MI723_15730 [Caulobacterales bacterium]|nr:hypothetical protein [Caulobacterales bacterium]
MTLPEQVRLLDMGCSYGINSATLNHDLTMRELSAYYTSAPRGALSARARLDADADFFTARRRDPAFYVAGVDTAANALANAQQAGLLHAGLAEDWEARDPSPLAQAHIRRTDMVISTGCVGYVTEASFERLAAAADPGARPWLALFVLRSFSIGPIAAAMARFGYVFDAVPDRSFVQRRAVDAVEAEGYRDCVADRGVELRDGERGGVLLADFYLGRPERDAAVDVGLALTRM